MASADMQWPFYSGEQIVAHEHLVCFPTHKRPLPKKGSTPKERVDQMSMQLHVQYSEPSLQ